MIFFNSASLAFGLPVGLSKMQPAIKNKELHSTRMTDKQLKSVVPVYSILTIMGYFPLIGIITGIWRQRMVENSTKGTRNSTFCTISKVRSWMEIIGLGSLFLIPDVIFTIGRQLTVDRVVQQIKYVQALKEI